MLGVGIFAFFLVVVLVVGDWIYFTSLTASASRYGCGIAKNEDPLPLPALAVLAERFDGQGLMNLPHGVARLFQDEQRILLRPQYRLFSFRFRTAWPIKGTIKVEPDGEGTRLKCVKRIPWSSALMTLVWFGIVVFGTLWFGVAYAMQGGMASLGSVLMGMGVIGTGILVLAFGLVTVAFAYRLENDRLGQAYRELREVLRGTVQ